MLWAAGVQGSPLAAPLGAPLDHAGRVRVGPLSKKVLPVLPLSVEA